MEGMDWLIWVASFVTGTFFVYGILHYVGNRRLVKERFKKTAAAEMPLYRHGDSSLKKRFIEWVSSFGKLAMKEQQDISQLRMALIQAGFRHPKGTAIYFGIRALAAFTLPLPYLLANAMQGVMSSGNLGVCLLLAAMGFYLPPLLLRVMTRRRQDRIDRALPDVLDLMIVCMEAGLSLLGTINRVADEVKPISMDLYKELHLTNAELRAGIPREQALRNMEERTGVQNVKALVSMMIQSDRLGTSISHALRIHAAFLRTQRSQRAEEKAAKLPVKILFPMLLFIFPAVFIVVLGPAAIHIIQSSVFKVGG